MPDGDHTLKTEVITDIAGDILDIDPAHAKGRAALDGFQEMIDRRTVVRVGGIHAFGHPTKVFDSNQECRNCMRHPGVIVSSPR